MTARIESKRNIMNRAWEISRAAVKKHGGKVVQFFAEALRQAWQEFKSLIGEVLDMDMYSRIKAYKSLKIIAEELESEMNKIKDSIIAEMNGSSKLVVGEYKLSYTESTRETLDKKRLEADLGSLAEYTKTTIYKRFCVV